MTGDTESLRTVAVNGIVNDENAHRITLSKITSAFLICLFKFLGLT